MSGTRQIVVLSFLGWLTSYAGRTVLYPMLVFISNEFGISNTVTGTIVSIYFVAFAVAQVPSGIIGARIGYKPLLIISCSLTALSLAAMAVLTKNLHSLMLLVALYGFGTGVFGVSSWAAVMHNVPDRIRGLSASLITSGMSIGLAVGLVIAGPIVVSTQNWRYPFLFLAIPTLFVAIGFALMTPDSGLRSKLRVDNPLALLRDRQLVMLSLTTLFSMLAFNVVLTWGPTFLLTQRGMAIDQAGLYIGFVALGGLPGAIVAGRLSDKFGRRRVSLIQFALTAVIIAMFPLLYSHRLLAANLVLYGFVGKLAWDAVSIPWLTDHITATQPGQFGAALGLFNLFAMVGAVVAPAVSGWLRDITGSLNMAFYMATIAVIISLGLVCFSRSTSPRPVSVAQKPYSSGWPT